MRPFPIYRKNFSNSHFSFVNCKDWKTYGKGLARTVAIGRSNESLLLSYGAPIVFGVDFGGLALVQNGR